MSTSKRPRQRLTIEFLSLSFVFLFVAACKPTDLENIRRAEQESLAERSQLAKYLYVQVVKGRSSRDEVRLKALEGLVEVTTTQTFEYQDAAKAVELAIQDFGQDPQYQKRMDTLRRKGFYLYKNNLQDSNRALEIALPIVERSDAPSSFLNDIGSLYLSLRMFEDTEKILKRAWDAAEREGSCQSLKSIQMNFIQRFVLEKKCDIAFGWMDRELPSKCMPDEFAVQVERAHCLEMSNEAAKAIKIYEEMIQKDPSNSKAHFFLDSLRRRIKEKQLN